MRTIILAGSAAVAMSLSVSTAFAASPNQAIIDKSCWGFYDAALGGNGVKLERPEAAFKFSVKADGSFVFTAKAGAAARKNWNGASGNDYLTQKEAQYQPLPDGGLQFANQSAHSYYTLTPAASQSGDAPGSVRFSVLYKHNQGTANGEAFCK